jgi:hypothetical protein
MLLLKSNNEVQHAAFSWRQIITHFKNLTVQKNQHTLGLVLSGAGHLFGQLNGSENRLYALLPYRWGAVCYENGCIVLSSRHNSVPYEYYNDPIVLHCALCQDDRGFAGMVGCSLKPKGRQPDSNYQV